MVELSSKPCLIHQPGYMSQWVWIKNLFCHTWVDEHAPKPSDFDVRRVPADPVCHLHIDWCFRTLGTNRLFSSGGFKRDWIIFHFIYGMSSFPLTNSIIFQDGYCTTNQSWSAKLFPPFQCCFLQPQPCLTGMSYPDAETSLDNLAWQLKKPALLNGKTIYKWMNSIGHVNFGSSVMFSSLVIWVIWVLFWFRNHPSELRDGQRISEKEQIIKLNLRSKASEEVETLAESQPGALGRIVHTPYGEIWYVYMNVFMCKLKNW